MNCFSLFLLLSEPTKVAKLDIGFAIGAASSDASNTLQHMKDIVKTIVDMYGTDKIHYGLITFDNEASIKLPFSRQIDSAEALKFLIDSLPTTTGGPAVDKALEAAKTLFGGEGVRYDAHKVLVLMVDKKSSGDDLTSIKEAMELKESGVNIITVAVGVEPDHGALKNITSPPGNVINTTTTDKPDEVGERIVDRTGAEVLLYSE